MVAGATRGDEDNGSRWLADLRERRHFSVMGKECWPKVGTQGVPAQLRTAKHHPAIIQEFAVIH